MNKPVKTFVGIGITLILVIALLPANVAFASKAPPPR
jgi:hypothetical protein